MKIEFFVPGTPKGQPRPRAFSRGGKASVYDPGTAEGWKGCIALAARQYVPSTPIDDPVSLDLQFVMPRPKCLSRKKDPDGRIWHTGKPDRDNLDKAVLDTLTQIGMWRDDAQVVRGTITKMYAAKGEIPGVHIELETL